MTTTHERVPILSINDLSVDYETDYGPFSALRGITFDVAPGEILGLVGESGCGKSTLGRSLLRLNDEASTRYQGSIHLDGTEVLDLKDTSLPSLRGIRDCDDLSRSSPIAQPGVHDWHPAEECNQSWRNHRQTENPW